MVAQKHLNCIVGALTMLLLLANLAECQTKTPLAEKSSGAPIEQGSGIDTKNNLSATEQATLHALVPTMLSNSSASYRNTEPSVKAYLTNPNTLINAYLDYRGSVRRLLEATPERKALLNSTYYLPLRQKARVLAKDGFDHKVVGAEMTRQHLVNLIGEGEVTSIEIKLLDGFKLERIRKECTLHQIEEKSPDPIG